MGRLATCHFPLLLVAATLTEAQPVAAALAARLAGAAAGRAAADRFLDLHFAGPRHQTRGPHLFLVWDADALMAHRLARHLGHVRHPHRLGDLLGDAVVFADLDLHLFPRRMAHLHPAQFGL